MIGRKREIEILNRLYNSNRAEFVAIYGRRRVGKTFLVDEVFDGRITFRHAGLSRVDARQGALKNQLKSFYNALIDQGMSKSHVPDCWLDAFFLLEQFLKEKDKGERQLVFLDELPWLDTPRSGFMTAFESFWNNWGCHRKNLMVVVCGSANSWILDKLINNHGGLYNRLTYSIKLSPFTLSECEEFYKSNSVGLSRYDIVQSYMILGGIPYYMGYFEKGKSLAQNIDSMFFAKGAILRDEYERLFSSAFSKPDAIRRIVEFLHRKSLGYTRKEISEGLHFTDGGTLSDYLKALSASDFIVKYKPFGSDKRQEYYKLTDPFCLFYLHFRDKLDGADEFFWQKGLSTQQIVSWRGFAFEQVCFNHISQIKRALEINGVQSTQSAWTRKGTDDDGSQIDHHGQERAPMMTALRSIF